MFTEVKDVSVTVLKKPAILVLALSIALCIFNGLSFEASAEFDLPVHNIDTGLDYPTIQEAIDANTTLDGHVIRVDAGTYYEPVVVDKAVSLVGESKFDTIVDGENNRTVIYATADNVNITGFTVQNSAFLSEYSGIHLDRSSGSDISDIIARDNYRGIYLGLCDTTVIRNVNTSNNSRGIALGDSSNNVISNINASNNDFGISLTGSINNILSHIEASGNYRGILISGSDSNTLLDIYASNNEHAIHLYFSTKNTLFGVSASNNEYGVYLTGSTYNNFLCNDVLNNQFGIGLISSSNNSILHNNFINNVDPPRSIGSINYFDYGLEGNFWSRYNGADNDEDGIGDTPFIIDGNNRDNYPLMGTFSDFNVIWGEEMYSISIICNSTISEFHMDTAEIMRFNVTGPDNAVGFCRIKVPVVLINGPYVTLVDGQEINSTVLPITNATHTFLYFTYLLSTHEVTVASRAYYDLLQKYNNLAADFQVLNMTYHQLLNDYSNLIDDYRSVLDDLDELQANHDTLSGQYVALNSTYNNLLAVYNELESRYALATDELASIRTLMYLFTATTIVVGAVLVSLSIKFYRTFNEQKALIQTYKRDLDKVSHLERARVRFEEDMKERKEKIEQFEKKYNVRIRPHNKLEDIIESLKQRGRREREG